MRRFEFSTGGSDKFWEIELKGTSFAVKFGRIGTMGQVQEKTFPTEEKAKQEHDKLIAEKLKKGYVEIQSTASAVGNPIGSSKRSAEGLKQELAKAGVNVATFERVRLPEEDEDEEDEGSRKDLSNAFYMVGVPASEATALWERQRSLVERTGYWPIITDNWDELIEYMEFSENTPAHIVSLSGSVDVSRFLQNKSNGDRFGQREDGTWPEIKIVGDEEFHTVRSAGSDAVTMIFCPTKVAWHVPAVLNWGGSNDGMEPFEHAAVLKYWNKEYGAELVCATMSVLEMKVANPPRTKEEALKLAREQCIYCPDIVDQGTNTIARLAAELLNSPHWFFWWD
jgi:predicted DNA-binding WGR domain protein